MGLLVHWLMLFGFWLVLSGFFDALHVTEGLVCTAAVALLSRPLQIINLTHGRTLHLGAAPNQRLFVYAWWLLREIAVANWQVVKIVLNPALPIDPALVRFRTQLATDLGVTIFANSITLTPGTITVQVDGGEFVIHALVGGEPVVTGLSSMQGQIVGSLRRLEPLDVAA
jgi:multicomponent Na+:H+ antiporter subunit E